MASDIEKLGRAGESIIINHYSKKGLVIEASVDQFDNKKDLIIGGVKCEVKTQVPFVTKNLFSFKPNQLKKCLAADVVFFISVPNKHMSHYSDGNVYGIPGDKFEYFRGNTNDGRAMIFVPIGQPNMKKMFSITEEECKICQQYSNSGWN